MCRPSLAARINYYESKKRCSRLLATATGGRPFSRRITRGTTKLRRSNGRKLWPVNKVKSLGESCKANFTAGLYSLERLYASFKLLSILPVLIANYIVWNSCPKNLIAFECSPLISKRIKQPFQEQPLKIKASDERGDWKEDATIMVILRILFNEDCPRKREKS